VRTKRATRAKVIPARLPLLAVDLATTRTHAQVWAELLTMDVRCSRIECREM
jgi:hypothetical protein